MTEALLRWFATCKRELPWRESRTPYRVWLAEMMLLQTQVQTVIPYYVRWLTRFPDIASLAGTTLDEVLKHWEGLGYYRRARYVHQAAQIMVREGIPDSYDTWRRLPGVGPYAAAAIASILHGEAVVAVDGNIRRVAARVFRLEDVSEKTVQQALFPFLPEAHPGDFNEALMELGATICTPRNPACLACPIQKHCQAYRTGTVAKYPKRQARARVPHHRRYALVWMTQEHIALRQRGDNEMLSGLWGFVLSDEKPDAAKELSIVTHAYTHFRLTVTPLLVTAPPEDSVLIAHSNLAGLALSTLDYKILAVLNWIPAD
jgi:A/G-specific adenine glycosylase